MKETSNTDDPAYVKSSRWRDYYRIRLAILYIYNDNLNNYTDGTGDPLPKFISDELIYKDKNKTELDKDKSLEALQKLAVKYKEIAEQDVWTVAQWIEFLIQKVFYQATANTVLGFNYSIPPGNTWNGLTPDQIRTPFLYLYPTITDPNGNTKSQYLGFASESALQGKNQGVQGYGNSTIDVASFLGIPANEIDNYEINLSTIITGLQESFWMTYNGTYTMKYFIEVKKISNRYWNLSCAIFALHAYYGGCIGVNIIGMAKQIT